MTQVGSRRPRAAEAGIQQIVTPFTSVSEARLSRVLDMAGDGIAVLDAAATILVFNRACELMSGWTAPEVAGRPIDMVLTGLEAEVTQPVDGAMQMRQRIGAPQELLARHRDGSLYPVEVSVAGAATPDGIQFICILRDLRPRREAEERLALLRSELNHLARVAALDQMGSALAHELNQPLTAICLYLQAAGRLLTDDVAATASPVIAKARREAERAGQIISSMRSFVEKRVPSHAPVALDPLVDDAVDLTLLGRRSAIQVTRRAPKKDLIVHVDAIQVQQVAVNLLRNALDAVEGQERGRIEIVTRAGDGCAWFSVTDSGAGIAANAMADLFRPFATSKRSGLGLGLAISRAIAESHGGVIRVDPGGGGRGATFSLALPLAGGVPESRQAARKGV
ncbi:MAG: ATP-binding protein [Phreatobacter sp.]|nr:ATP-binding protein [Phreatobacter sp.]